MEGRAEDHLLLALAMPLAQAGLTRLLLIQRLASGADTNSGSPALFLGGAEPDPAPSRNFFPRLVRRVRLTDSMLPARIGRSGGFSPRLKVGVVGTG